MRVAALYDVHGNVHALETVLDDVARAGAHRVVFGGDIVSGPFPRETLELVRSVDNAAFILGNADLLATASPVPEWDEARRWVEAQLDERSVRWLAQLPFSTTLDDTLYVHANPVDVEQIVTERTPDARVEQLLDGVTARRVVTGHVHMQFRRSVGGIEWIGAGSVGMPYEGSPGAYWALLDAGDVELRRTEYDLEAAAAAVRASGYPMAAQLADENILRVPSRDEALAVFSP